MKRDVRALVLLITLLLAGCRIDEHRDAGAAGSESVSIGAAASSIVNHTLVDHERSAT